MRSGRAQSVRRLAVLFALSTLMPAAAATVWAAEPVVSVWYRGNPAGTPRQSDLGAIRALGFTGVVWPTKFDTGIAELRRLAALVGLTVIVADAPVQATGQSTLDPPERVDIVITPETAGLVMALSWRAVAHGARSIAFDSRSPTGAGLVDRDDSLKPWVPSAISVARQLTANSRLADEMRPGPGVTVTPNAAPALDVVLLDANRAWVVVATNTSSAFVNATARLPAGTPYALWVSWLEGPPLAMISEPAGPRWILNLEPRGARVYIIDKIVKEQTVKP